MLKNNVKEINKDVIGIAGNIPADYKYNMKMIQIAEKFAHQYNKKVFIRLHPTDREENYNLDTKSTFPIFLIFFSNSSNDSNNISSESLK